MQAPGYVESNQSTIRYREYTHQLHKRKLKEIQQQSQGRLTAQPGETSKYMKVKPQPFHEIERHAVIKRENQLLLDKLVEISYGKRPVNPSNISKILNVNQPKSLNIHTRKKEAERIAAENEALAKRLMEKTPHLSKKRFDMQYQSAIKYKKQISKSYLFRRRPKSRMNLPPIEESKRTSLDKLSITRHRRNKSKKSLSPPDRKRNRSMNLTDRRIKDKSMSASQSRLHPNKLSFYSEAKAEVIKSNDSAKELEDFNTETATNEEFKYDDMNFGSRTERISIKTRESLRAYNEEMADQNAYMEDEYGDSFEDFEETSHKSTDQPSQSSQENTQRSEISLLQKINYSKASLIQASSQEIIEYGHQNPPEEMNRESHNGTVIVISEALDEKIPSRDEQENQEVLVIQQEESEVDISRNHLNFSTSKNKSNTSSNDSITINNPLKRNESEQTLLDKSLRIPEDPSELDQSYSKRSSMSSVKDTPILHKISPVNNAQYEEYDEDFESDIEDEYKLHIKDTKSGPNELEIVIDSDQSEEELSKDKILPSHKSEYNPSFSKSDEYLEKSYEGSDLEPDIGKNVSVHFRSNLENSRQSQSVSLRSIKATGIKEFIDHEGSDTSLHIDEAFKIENGIQIHSGISSPKSSKLDSVILSQGYQVVKDVSSPLSQDKSLSYDRTAKDPSTHSSRRSSKAASIQNSQEYQDKSYEASLSIHNSHIPDLKNNSQKSSKPSSIQNSLDYKDKSYEASLSYDHTPKDPSTHSSRRSSKTASIQNSQEYQEKSYEASISIHHTPTPDVKNNSQKSSKPTSIQNSLDYKDKSYEAFLSIHHSPTPDLKKNSQKSSKAASIQNSQVEIDQNQSFQPIISESYIQNHKSSFLSEIKSPHSIDLLPSESYIKDEKSSVISEHNLSPKSKEYERSPEIGESSFLSEMRSPSINYKSHNSYEDLLSNTTSPIVPTNLNQKFLEESFLNKSSKSKAGSIGLSLIESVDSKE